MVPGLCRDCLAPADDDEVGTSDRCPRCGSARLLRHPELDSLTLAHIDCDAFYAAIEKRDNPAIAERPVIVGGGRRGVVATACYIARRYGVRSAMPMFKALELCPEAVIVPSDMRKYAAVARQVRAVFLDATPLVEAVSLDEAYLDLAGTESLHRRKPAQSLACIARRIEREIGITASIGLSHNRFLAKLACEMDKPRGFGVIGRQEARAVLATRPVRAMPGVGEAMARRLAADGIETVAHLQATGAAALAVRYGAIGRRLGELAEGRDERNVVPERPAKGISAETTFETDLRLRSDLEAELWPLCERVSGRLKNAATGGRTVVLKLKTAQFRLLTRQRTLAQPTQLAETIYRTARQMLGRETGARRFRLIGVGVAELCPAVEADPPDFVDPAARTRVAVERAVDQLRARFGQAAIAKGRGFKSVRPARIGKAS
ncbi:MAG: DNA polymerase IV [Pseudomonadota bacterium]